MTQERSILAGGCFWGMQDLIRKRDGVIEIVNAERVLDKTGNVWTEQPAAGRHDQPIVDDGLPLAVGGHDDH